MSRIQLLTAYIKKQGECSYDEVKKCAFAINCYWRESSWTRALRARKDIKALKPINVITGYRYIPLIPENLEVSSDLSDKFDDLSKKPVYEQEMIKKSLELKNSLQPNLL